MNINPEFDFKKFIWYLSTDFSSIIRSAGLASFAMGQISAGWLCRGLPAYPETGACSHSAGLAALLQKRKEKLQKHERQFIQKVQSLPAGSCSQSTFTNMAYCGLQFMWGTDTENSLFFFAILF